MRGSSQEVGAEFPDVAVDYLHVDAATIFLTTDPARFDVIVTDNLFGDIITDLAAAITGGIGLAASGNINPDRTAPRCSSRCTAPPPTSPASGRPTRPPRSSSTALMLDHLGFAEAAARVERGRRRRPAPSRAPRRHVRVGDRRARCGDAIAARSWLSRGLPMPAMSATPIADQHLDIATTASDARAARQVAEILANPGFGIALHRPHVHRRVDTRAGWHDARITTYGPLSLDPATAVLHYAQETFEGMKAYRHADGSIWTFRPEENAERMARSSHRLALPELDPDDFVQAVDALVEADQRWVPDGAGEKSLYLRPFMFASEVFLGVRPAQHVTFMVIASPAGAYFKGGVKPVTLWLTEEYTRAGRGGTGAAKSGGNYAASLVAAAGGDRARLRPGGLPRRRRGEVRRGARRHEHVLRVRRRHIVTPETGTILEGITRSAIIELAQKQGHKVDERRFSIDEWRDGVASGDITEVFACGTAAVVTPVGTLKWDGGEVGPRRRREAGPLTMEIRQDLVDIQYGRADDTFGWMHRVV